MGLLNILPEVKERKGWPWTEESSLKELNSYPKISIVTPSFNQGIFIEETIRSILLQNYPNLEFIVIDGGSTDQTVELLEKYTEWITYWVSERDSGQPEAINKGIAKCTGIIFNWINSDDYLPPGALFRIAEEYLNPQIDLLAGAVKNFNSKGETSIDINKNLDPVKMILKSRDMVFHQPGVWYKTELLRQAGLIASNFHYCFDWHLVIRYLITFPNVKYTEDVLVNFRLHDASKTVSVPIRFQEDNIAIARELKELPYFGNIKSELDLYVNRKEWYVWLIKLQSTEVGKFTKISRVILASVQDIPNRWSRYTLGAIKQIILHD